MADNQAFNSRLPIMAEYAGYKLDYDPTTESVIIRDKWGNVAHKFPDKYNPSFSDIFEAGNALVKAKG